MTRHAEKIAAYALLLLLTATLIYAHPGRLDSNGGHYDRADGSYHYHTGESAGSGSSGGSAYYSDNGRTAHTHPDGVCPYGQQSTVPIPEIPKDSKTSTGVSKVAADIVGILLLYIFFAAPIIGAIALFAIILLDSIFKTNMLIAMDSYSVAFLPLLLFFPYFVCLVLGYEIYWEHWVLLGIAFFCILWWFYAKGAKIKEAEVADKNKYIQLFSEYTMDELCSAPLGTTIGNDGLPKELNAERWGYMYTFYVSRTGNVFHLQNCNKSATIPIHALRARQSYTPCKKCHPQTPEMEWYKEYIRLMDIKKKYDIKTTPV